MAYPVTFDVQPPAQFDKAQVALRILILLVLQAISNFILWGAYLVVPVLAALLVSQKGSEKYLAEAQEGPVKWLRYLMMFYSYLALATDRLSTEKPEDSVQLNVRPTGSPTVGQALLRIILAIPHAIVLAILGIVLFFVWIIAAGSILVNGTAPGWAEGFIRGYLRWNARVLAYMASLVDEYPPFSFENGGEAAPAATAPPPSSPPAAEPPASPSPPAEPPASDAPPADPPSPSGDS